MMDLQQGKEAFKEWWVRASDSDRKKVSTFYFYWFHEVEVGPRLVAVIAFHLGKSLHSEDRERFVRLMYDMPDGFLGLKFPAECVVTHVHVSCKYPVMLQYPAKENAAGPGFLFEVRFGEFISCGIVNAQGLAALIEVIIRMNGIPADAVQLPRGGGEPYEIL